jgi:hypothetical protein
LAHEHQDALLALCWQDSVQFDFDLINHDLVGTLTDGSRESLALEPRPARAYRRDHVRKPIKGGHLLTDAMANSGDQDEAATLFHQLRQRCSSQSASYEVDTR